MVECIFMEVQVCIATANAGYTGREVGRTLTGLQTVS